MLLYGNEPNLKVLDVNSCGMLLFQNWLYKNSPNSNRIEKLGKHAVNVKFRAIINQIDACMYNVAKFISRNLRTLNL